jgi:hypothetical protein
MMGKNISICGNAALHGSRARNRSDFIFETPIPSLKENDRSQGKGLVRRFWLICSLRTGSQSAATKKSA